MHRLLFFICASLFLFQCASKSACRLNCDAGPVDARQLMQDTSLFFVNEVYFGSPIALVESEHVVRLFESRAKLRKEKSTNRWRRVTGVRPLEGRQLSAAFVGSLESCLLSENRDNYLVFSRLTRILAEGYLFVRENALDSRSYLLHESKELPGFDVNRLFHDTDLKSLEHFAHNSSRAFSPSESIAFWLAMEEGDRSEMWLALLTLLRFYDNEWCIQHIDHR